MTPPAPEPTTRVILDADEIARTLTRMAHELLEANHGPDHLVLLGIKTRGVPLARRIAQTIAAAEGVELPVGELDVTMYRDDLRRHPTRAVGRSHVPVDVEGCTVVLVDDVLYSGRTVLAALDALKDLGRPAAVRLAVLVDRGHRELPIQADTVGKVVRTAGDEQVRVRLVDPDGLDQAVLERRAEVTR